MNINFGEHIVALLQKNECVVLPHFGAFLLKEKPAYIANGMVFPSNKSIVFDQRIVQDNDLLSATLINQHKISLAEAKKEIEQFIQQIKFELKEKGVINIFHLGTFQQNTLNEIIFTENSQLKALDLAQFGLANVHLRPIHREIIKEETPTIAFVPTKTSKAQKRYPQKIALVASFILLLAVGSLLLSDVAIKPLQIQNANVLQFLVPNKSIANTKHHIKTAEASEIILPIAENRVEKNEDIVENTFPKVYKKVLKVQSENPKGYYIITGAFSKLANAKKAKNKCVHSKKCRIFKAENGMYRVGFFADAQKELAVAMIEDYKKANQSFWLLDNRFF